MMFRDLVVDAQDRSNSTLAIGLAPSVKKLPPSILRFDEPLLPFGKAVIDATGNLVCAYVFHLAPYLALGGAGAVALERTMAYVPARVLKILHGPFASADYAPAVFEDAFGANAVTLAPTVDPAVVTAFTQASDHAAFVEAPEGFNVRPILKMNEDYPGQVGIYRHVTPGHRVFGLLYEPFPEIHWYMHDTLYTSVDDNFRDTLHSTAAKLREKPTAET